ncbi:hypothetical protein JCM6882_009134 [Rhodosporidiobolus microsporus]
MLLSLPTELVEHIVRLAIPSEYSSATYLDRQDTLRQLCLVCRDLRKVAQPVLHEVVRVGMDSTVARVEELLKLMSVKRRLRVVALEGVNVDLSHVGEECINLRDLRITDVQGDLTWAARFSGPDEEPNLLLSPVLLAQLDTLVMMFPQEGIPIDGTQPRVLLDVPFSLDWSDLEFLVSKGAQHVRIFVRRAKGKDLDNPAGLNGLAATLLPISRSSKSLRLLYLPTLYRPSLVRDEAIATEVEKLSAVCGARGIEVDYEDTDESAGESRVSPKFAAYVRRIREKEQAEEVGEGTGAGEQ